MITHYKKFRHECQYTLKWKLKIFFLLICIV
nr:MAG TPA: hypothetical protein [Caudoviricetes sp.]